MNAEQRQRIWRRAAVYGSLWAAVEIVVGSFLHNLRVPFAGSVLGAVGVVLMTAGHRSQPERGLIWRSAVVCALMKSVSPSAVILGPMVGIFMEGLLLESMVRLFGGRSPGYLVGGALAVSWSMVQRVGNAVITYGPDVVRLYVDAYRFASKSLGVASFGPIDLLAAAVGIEMLMGCLAAWFGLRVERAGTRVAPSPRTRANPAASSPRASRVAMGRWSIPSLVAVTVALISGMALQPFVPLWTASAFVALFVAMIAHNYPIAVGRVLRPSLWVEVVGVILCAGLVFGGIRNGLDGLAGGALAGVGMALRAVMVVFGFVAISVELRNPVILARLERRHLQGLSDAMGVAFGALPEFLAALSDSRSSWRRPGQLAAALLQLADSRVNPGASEVSVTEGPRMTSEAC